MKSIFKDLVIDRELVKTIKKANVNSDHLYNQVINGRITLPEYLLIMKSKTA